MSVYAKQGDNVVLLLSRAEANALLAHVYDDAESREKLKNGRTQEALQRAMKALTCACEPASRSGAAF